MSRHPEPGAGAEYEDPRDSSCDMCGKTVYTGLLHQVTFGNSLSWWCSACWERHEARRKAMGDAA